MRKLTATLCLVLAVLLGSGGMSGNVFAQTVDFAVRVTDYVSTADKIIYRTDYVSTADEIWNVWGGCSNRPNLTIYITDYVSSADKIIYITDYVSTADKTVCITNPKDLDEETLKDLGLID